MKYIKIQDQSFIIYKQPIHLVANHIFQQTKMLKMIELVSHYIIKVPSI